MDRVLQGQLERDSLLHCAVEWFLELRASDVSIERIAAWEQWLSSSPAHREAFERIESLWNASAQVTPKHWLADCELASDGYEGPVSVSEWHESRAQRESSASRPPHRTREEPSHAERASMRARHWQWSRLAVAAGLVATAIALGWSGVTVWPRVQSALLGVDSIRIETDVGETRSIALTDGSTALVGGHSILKTRLTRHAREVVLERGEGFFKVAKDPARPFIVHAGDASVTAVGTAFNVRRAGERLVVAVAEGVVRVAAQSVTPPVDTDAADASEGTTAGEQDQRPAQILIRTAQLKAGQQLSVGSGEMPQLSEVDPRAVAGWQHGRLHYFNERLDVVVADIARYSNRSVRIVDKEVAAVRVTGVVFQQNIEGWLWSLEATFPVRVTKQADGTLQLESRQAR
jgi:transmembrane sensor